MKDTRSEVASQGTIWRTILRRERDSIGADAGTADIISNSLSVNSNPVSANIAEESSKMDDEICPDTGLKWEDCPCMICHPPAFFFKYTLSGYEIENTDDVISALRDRKAFFEQLKTDGFKLMGQVDDHFAEFEPPMSDEFYWVQCRSGGCYLRIQAGELPSKECPKCGRNVYSYEE
jgi:hypothetical protein